MAPVGSGPIVLASVATALAPAEIVLASVEIVLASVGTDPASAAIAPSRCLVIWRIAPTALVASGTTVRVGRASVATARVSVTATTS
jgi:hypothetical protein